LFIEFCLCLTAFSQGGHISGTVRDGRTGESMATVAVQLVETHETALTGASGRFELGPNRLRWRWAHRCGRSAGRDSAITTSTRRRTRECKTTRGKTLTGGYAQESWNGLRKRVYLTGRIRWDSLDVSGRTVASPQESAAFLPTQSTRLQVAWGQYAQFPDVQYLFAAYGNRNLLPSPYF
jgi:hypothetical protein